MRWFDRRSRAHCPFGAARLGPLLLTASIALSSVAPLWSAPDLLRGTAAQPTISDAGDHLPEAPADNAKSAAPALDTATPASSDLTGLTADPDVGPLWIFFLDRCRPGYRARVDRPPALA